MSASKVLKMMKDKQIEFVDLRFTDPRGKFQHLTMDASVVDGDMLTDGVFFDGSSIAVFAEFSNSTTDKFSSNSLRHFSALLTGSLFNKVIFNL